VIHIEAYNSQTKCFCAGGLTIRKSELQAQPSEAEATKELLRRYWALEVLKKAKSARLGVKGKLTLIGGVWRRSREPIPQSWPLTYPLEDDTVVLIWESEEVPAAGGPSLAAKWA
jgi:hypothetical protein